MALSRWSLPAGLTCGALLSGCLMTTAAGDELRQQGQARDERIATLEQSSQQSRSEMDAKMHELEQVLERATNVVTRNSADSGAQVEAMREQLARLEGTLEEVRHKLEGLIQEQALYKVDLEGRLATKVTGAKPAIDAAEIPADPEAHYKAGQAAYQAGDHEKARALFREFLVRYAADAKAGNAQYWIGASYLSENKPAAALGELRKVIATYDKSTAVNVALYGMADAFFRLKACSDAQSAAQTLIKRKPDAALIDRIRKLAADIKSAAKSASCTS